MQFPRSYQALVGRQEKRQQPATRMFSLGVGTKQGDNWLRHIELGIVACGNSRNSRHWVRTGLRSSSSLGRFFKRMSFTPATS